MNGCRFIPGVFFVAVLASGQLRQEVATAQSIADDGSTGPYFIEPVAEDCSTPKPIFVPPDQVWLQPAAPVEMVPILPLPESVGPRPGELMGPMWGGVAPPAVAPLPNVIYPPAEAGSVGGPLENIAPGGAVSPRFGLPAGPETVAGLANPIAVPAINDEFTWEQIADVVSNYFTISREQQVRRSGEAWSEGRIETAYQGGATWLEPFRKDSVGAFNRWESTFQTIRRSAVVRVIPDANGFLVEVVVQKEIEDLPRPERAMAGVASFPNDTPLTQTRTEKVSRTVSSSRWLPLGRDPALEARMLAEIHARLSGVTTASSPSIWPSIWP